MLLFGLVGVCSGESYNLKVSLSPTDFLGACNQTQITNGELGGYGQCIGEFFNPTIPNPITVLTPVTGNNLKEKVDAVNVFNLDSNAGIGDIFGKFLNIPLVLLFSILELLASAIKYILVFAVKFVFVYLFYISLGFQSIILLFDQNSNGLDDVRKIQATVAIMAIASVITLCYGGAWVTW
jgi:hypothetical protein